MDDRSGEACCRAADGIGLGVYGQVLARAGHIQRFVEEGPPGLRGRQCAGRISFGDACFVAGSSMITTCCPPGLFGEAEHVHVVTSEEQKGPAFKNRRSQGDGTVAIVPNFCTKILIQLL